MNLSFVLVLVALVVVHAYPLDLGNGVSIGTDGLNVDSKLKGPLGMGSNVKTNVGLNGAKFGLESKVGDKKLVDTNAGVDASGVKTDFKSG